MRYWLVLLIFAGVVLVFLSFLRFPRGHNYAFESEKSEKIQESVVVSDLISIRTEDRRQKNIVVMKAEGSPFVTPKKPEGILKISPPKEGWDYVK